MFLFDQCPKCRGTVTLISELDGNELQCIHCGFSVSIQHSDGMSGNDLQKVLKNSSVDIKKNG